jgi:hypothetical protein
VGWRANPWHGSRGGHAGHVAHQVLGSRPVQHVVRHYAPTRSTTRIAHQVLGSRGVQRAARHGQVVLNRRAARVLRLSQRRLPVQATVRTPALSPTLRLATRQPSSVFAQPTPVQPTRVAQVPHVAIPNVFHTRIAPVSFRPAQHAAARFVERSVAKVPGRARPPRFPALRHYTAGQRRYINRAVQRYGRAAARDRGYQSAGAASRAGVNLGGQIAQYGEPQAKRALAVYQPMRTPTNLKPVKPGRGVRPETVPGDGSLGGFAAILSGGVHPVAGMSLAAAGRAVNKGFIAPSVKGTLDLAANTPGAIYNTGAAGFEALHGDFGRAKRLAHDFVNNDPIALLVQGRTHEAWKAVARNPVAATLEVAGLKGFAGRSVGRIHRAAGGSREAAPAVLEGTRIALRRPYSKDAITRQRQILFDRRGQRKAAALLRQAAVAEAHGRVHVARDLRQRALHTSPLHISNAQIRRRIDERNHANEQVRRALRSMATVRASKHVVAPRKGGHLVTLLAQGIIHPHRGDIQAYLAELDHHFKSGLLTKAQAYSNRTLAKEIRAALATKHLNLPALHAHAKAYATEQAAIEAHLVKAGLLDAAQAEKARLIPYSARRMGASHNGDHIVGPDGKFLSAAAIKQHMLHNGVNPDEVAYLSQAPNARNRGNFYKNTLQRHTISTPVRTGDATRFGTFDSHPTLLVHQAAREANLLAADHGFKGLVDEFGLRHDAGHPQAGQVRNFATKRGADLWIADQHAQGARELRAIRINPFLGRQRELHSLLDHVNQGTDVHPTLTDAQQMALQGTEGAGPWAVIHDQAAHRMDLHLRQQGPPAGARGIQVVNQAFRNAVLPLSTKWLTGNAVEAGFRVALERAGPLSWLTGRRVLGGPRPGIVARPGKLVSKFVGIRNVPGAIDRAATPEQALEARARTIGGGHYGMVDSTQIHTDAAHFEHSVLRPMAHALGAVARTPGPREVGNLWQRFTHGVFSANSMMESHFQTALAGKYIREMMPTKGELSVSRKAVEQAARGLTNTNEQVAMGRMIDRAYGKYGKFNPAERFAIAYYTPFVAWSLNAVKFVGSVLPKDHPVATGLLVAAQNASEQWLKDHGLNLWIKGAAPGWLQGSAPVGGGGKVRLGRYLPFGFFGDPAQSIASALMPQYAGAFLALNGVDWKGLPLRGPGGGIPTQGDKFGTALEQFFGGTVPILGQVQQVATKKGPLGQKLQRQFNPFYPVQNTASSGAAGPHDAQIDKALQNLPGGGGPHDAAIDRALKSYEAQHIPGLGFVQPQALGGYLAGLGKASVRLDTLRRQFNQRKRQFSQQGRVHHGDALPKIAAGVLAGSVANAGTYHAGRFPTAPHDPGILAPKGARLMSAEAQFPMGRPAGQAIGKGAFAFLNPETTVRPQPGGFLRRTPGPTQRARLFAHPQRAASRNLPGASAQLAGRKAGFAIFGAPGKPLTGRPGVLLKRFARYGVKSSGRVVVPAHEARQAIHNFSQLGYGHGQIVDFLAHGRPRKQLGVPAQVTRAMQVLKHVSNIGPGVPSAVPQQYKADVAKYGSWPGVQREAKKYGLTGPQLLAKIAKGESSFIHRLPNGSLHTSGKASGLAQFTPGNQAAYKKKYGVDVYADGHQAFHGMAIYMVHQGGLAGYNPGGGQGYINYILGQNVGKSAPTRKLTPHQRQAERVARRAARAWTSAGQAPVPHKVPAQIRAMLGHIPTQRAKGGPTLSELPKPVRRFLKRYLPQPSAAPGVSSPSNTSGIPVSTSSPGVSAGVASGKASGGKGSALSGLPAADAAALAQLLASQQGPVLATPLQAPAFSAGAVFPGGYTAGQVSLADILQRITGRARV